ncbi:MAG: DNA translocase FtsK [Arsenophonus sp. NC-PG7-MAG3]
MLVFLPEPVITCFKLELSPGIKGVHIYNLSRDLARSLSETVVRIIKVIQNNPYLG